MISTKSKHTIKLTLLFILFVIILIIIYLKINNKELYTSKTDIDNYFDNYYTTKRLYKRLQDEISVQGDDIKDLEYDIQIVLSGNVMTPRPTRTSKYSTDRRTYLSTTNPSTTTSTTTSTTNPSTSTSTTTSTTKLSTTTSSA